MAEWVILGVRIGLVLLLYLFLFQVARAIWRDLRAPQKAPVSTLPARLVVVEPGQTALRPGERLPLQEVNSLGRSAANSIPIEDDFVSSAHALLSYRQRQWWVEDLQSTNGTQVNQQPVTRPTILTPGDLLEIGRVKLRLEVGA